MSKQCWLDADRPCTETCKAYTQDYTCSLLEMGKGFITRLDGLVRHLTAYRHQPPPPIT